MEIKLKRSTSLSLLFFSISVVIFILPHFIDRNFHRILLSYLTLYLFYPSLLLSAFFSIKSFRLINSNQTLIKRNKWIFLNFFSLAFLVYFGIKLIWIFIDGIMVQISE